jgi:hypothetical protein
MVIGGAEHRRIVADGPEVFWLSRDDALALASMLGIPPPDMPPGPVIVKVDRDFILGHWPEAKEAAMFTGAEETR